METLNDNNKNLHLFFKNRLNQIRKNIIEKKNLDGVILIFCNFNKLIY